MHVQQFLFRLGIWEPLLPVLPKVQLVLAFVASEHVVSDELLQSIEKHFPNAEVIGCSTAGEIYDGEVYEDAVTLTAIEFDGTNVVVKTTHLDDHQNSIEAGEMLAGALPKDDLRYAMVISDGLAVNGSDLVSGLSKILPNDVLLTGGLAGDGREFKKTVVWHNGKMQPGLILICGFYGERLRVSHGTMGGWTMFGPQRKITKSSSNVLYELDGEPALDLYKRYLGEYTDQLPASALRFPLSLQLEGENEHVVRTILGIDEAQKSLTFAGNMPQGATTRLMKTNMESIIDGAASAAEGAISPIGRVTPKLALLISCVGRRMVLGQRAYEEVESVKQILESNCPIIGFYSYGEISPLLDSVQCRLHNQTMCITILSEV